MENASDARGIDAVAMESSPAEVTLVLNTYNRSDLLPRAITAVTAQSVGGWELVVVDDGSTDDTPTVLAALADDRIRSTRHPNMGLTASRNAGAQLARGEWIAFIDDDDEIEGDWWKLLGSAITPEVGIVFAGHHRVTPDGAHMGITGPGAMSNGLGTVVGSFLPGTWIMRRSVFEACGGYLDGLPFIHQNELLVRAVPTAASMGLGTAAIADPVLRYTVRPPEDRPMVWPRYALDGGRWIRARHAQAFDADTSGRANLDSVIGVAAAREGRLDLARRHLGRAARAQPSSPKRWTRLLATTHRSIARRVWGRPTGPVDRPLPLPAVHQLTGPHRHTEDHYFLPWTYQRNSQASADVAGTPYWEKPSLNSVLYQEPVYRWAQRLVRRRGIDTVLDVGTGSGVKLEKYILPVARRTIGLDQGSGIQLARERCPQIEWIDGDLMAEETWSTPDARPGLTICADVIEHVEDPVTLLDGIRRIVGGSGMLIISTPDRLRYDQPDRLGPPGNPRHVREWSRDEFELLLESCGFEIIERRRFLPRGYRPTVLELKRQVWRALHLRRIPDRRSNAAWLCRIEPIAARQLAELPWRLPEGADVGSDA